MARAVTIKEVADRADVAVSTVSRVLNNKNRVSDVTRQRVRAAIDELGFVRNTFAASMKTGITRFIVVIVPDIINEFFTAVIQGVEAAASVRGYYTLVYASGESRSKEIEMLGGEFGHIVDGVILIPSTANSSFYKNHDKPTVVVDRDMPGNDLYTVVVDNYRGSRMLMEELIACGHTKIGVVTGPNVFNIGIERLSGYLDALSENRIPFRDEYIQSGTWYQEDGYKMMKALLELPDPPTAVFATNNLLCMGAMEAALDKRLAIGKDISIVGFDDFQFAKYVGEGITTVRRPTSEMGSIGAQILVDLIEKKDAPLMQTKLVMPVELIRRGSVATLR